MDNHYYIRYHVTFNDVVVYEFNHEGNTPGSGRKFRENAIRGIATREPYFYTDSEVDSLLNAAMTQDVILYLKEERP